MSDIVLVTEQPYAKGAAVFESAAGLDVQYAHANGLMGLVHQGWSIRSKPGQLTTTSTTPAVRPRTSGSSTNGTPGRTTAIRRTLYRTNGTATGWCRNRRDFWAAGKTKRHSYCVHRA